MKQIIYILNSIIFCLFIIPDTSISQREMIIKEMNSDNDAILEISGEDSAKSDYKSMILGFNQSSDGFLRTTTNHDLSLWTNNLRRFTVKKDGLVDIAGDAKINGVLSINDPSSEGYELPDSDGSNYQVLQTDGSGNVSWSYVDSPTISASSATGASNLVNNNAAAAGIPSSDRLFFMKIAEAPSEHAVNYAQLDQTEIVAYGYDFNHLDGKFDPCRTIIFKFRKSVDKASPMLRLKKFQGADLIDAKLIVYRNSAVGYRLETEIAISKSTIKQILLTTLYDDSGKSQLYEEVELLLDGQLFMMQRTYDENGSANPDIDFTWDCTTNSQP